MTENERMKSFCDRYGYVLDDTFVYDKLFQTRLITSKEWKDLRHKIFDRYKGVDVFLYTVDGVDEDAYILHHIIPVKDNPLLMFDENNLIPVSNRTHALIHIGYTKSAVEKALLQEAQRRALYQVQKVGVAV